MFWKLSFKVLLSLGVSQPNLFNLFLLIPLSSQCEVKLAHKRSRLESSVTGEEDDGEDDSDSDEETSAKARYFGYVKQGLYYVTEMERFAPPRKRPRTVIKNYRLVSLRSTTPEELYQRKVGYYNNLTEWNRPLVQA